MGGGRNPPLRRIDGDPFHPQRSLAGQEMVVKRLRSDRRDQWPDFSSPYAGYSFLQSLSGSSTISYMTGLSKPSRAYLASRRPILRELRLEPLARAREDKMVGQQGSRQATRFVWSFHAKRDRLVQ